MPSRSAWRGLVERALAEDLGSGDVTSQLVVSAEAEGQARIEAREPLVVCGLEVAAEVFAQVDPALRFDRLESDGASVEAGTALARVSGNMHAILSGERTALNFMTRLSGVASLTRRYVEITMSDTTDCNGPNGDRDSRGRFAIGNPGGPGHPGIRRQAELMRAVREAIEPEDIRAVLRAPVEAALGGDVNAAKLLLARCLGREPAEPPPVVELPEDLSTPAGVLDAGARILHAVAAGTVAPADAQKLLAGLESHRRSVELTDVDVRLRKLEARERIGSRR